MKEEENVSGLLNKTTKFIAVEQCKSDNTENQQYFAWLYNLCEDRPLNSIAHSAVSSVIPSYYSLMYLHRIRAAHRQQHRKP
jgi:hypothetical protein